MQRRASGLTFIEMMFVILIGILILILGLRQYELYRSEVELEQVKVNVDQLFLALANYYKANCKNANVFQPGAHPLPLSVQQLQQLGFLPTGWPAIKPLSIADYQGQFNAGAVGLRYYYACLASDETSAAGGQGDCTVPVTARGPQPPKTGVWVAQVAVRLADPTPGKALAYQGILAADCVSDTPTQCNQAASVASYLIWQRLPSFVSPELISPAWLLMPRLNQFQLEYTHDQMYEFQNTNDTPNYYQCGG